METGNKTLRIIGRIKILNEAKRKSEQRKKLKLQTGSDLGGKLGGGAGEGKTKLPGED